MDDATADRLRRERRARGWSLYEMARELHRADRTRSLPELDSIRRNVVRYESGNSVSERYKVAYAHAFGVDVDDLFGVGRPNAHTPDDACVTASRADGADNEEFQAWELARRATASDIGGPTLERLEQAVDDLAIAYPSTPPGELLTRVRRHLDYVEHLIDARKTLTEHRRLLTVGGWLSLLAATCAIDLHHWPAATARLRTAAELARETAHAELAGWCLETHAWQVLTDGAYRYAVELSQQAQRVAPRDGSAFIQATAQEGRAWARLDGRAETRDALNRVEALAAPLPMPDRPEHHYRYDPAKSEAYVATTLSWIGDPAAENYARQVLARLDTGADGPPRPRRAASARLDLSLALIAASKPDEAGGVALDALTSGRLVPSNYWRAGEVVRAIKAHGVPEATELHEAYRDICPTDHNTSPR